MPISVINPNNSVDLTAPSTNIGTVTAPAITVSTLFKSANSGNIPFVAQPSGTGGFQLQPTDSTATGGNARGINAIDLQLKRNAATNVASGAYSFVAGTTNTASGQSSIALGQVNTASGQASVALGLSNTASGLYCVALGLSNTASGQSSVALGFSNTASGESSVALGDANSASGLYCVALGASNTADVLASVALGLSNTASGQFSLALGLSNTASGLYSIALGRSNTASGQSSVAAGTFATTKAVTSLFSFAGAPISSFLGKNQTNILNLGIQTVSNTPTILISDQNAPSATNQLVLQNNSAVVVEGLAIATMTTAGDTKSWKISATIKRGSNATSTVLVGTPTVTMLHQDVGASTWTLAITADTTNGCMRATVTNEASKTIRVNLSLFASEVAF